MDAATRRYLCVGWLIQLAVFGTGALSLLGHALDPLAWNMLVAALILYAALPFAAAAGRTVFHRPRRAP
jgi:hypothetical protein